MRILVADDDAMVRTLLSATVESLGHQVEAFEDGQALWEFYEREPTQLVLADWMMPRLSGVELCRRIRASHGQPYTHVIIVTSLSASEHMVEAHGAGADDFLAKPVQRDLLERRIQVAVRGMLAQAEESMRRSVELCQNALGPEHAALLDAISALARVSREQRAYVRCRGFLRRELAISRRVLGAAAPRTLQLERELEEMSKLEDEF